MKINNVPDWAWGKNYIVARKWDNRWWFYDAWENENDACAQAWEIDGQIFHVDNCESQQ